MKQEKIWVVVANSSNARIFRLEHGKELIQIGNLDHPESRMHDIELVGDKPGRAFESANVTRHALSPKTSPHKLEFMLFAKEVSELLEKAWNNKEFDKWYLSASSSFLGLLREALSPHLTKTLAGSLEKDLTSFKQHEIAEHFTFRF